MTHGKNTLSAKRGEDILFFDMMEIEETYRVVRNVCEAKKHPSNPVMEQGDIDKWDSAQASPWPARTVLYDEEEKIFKTWYGGTDASPEGKTHLGYAISEDGIIWEKPELGLVEFEGSKRNNMVDLNCYAAIIKDYDEPDPSRRYKWSGKSLRYSPDGLVWTKSERLKIDYVGPKVWDEVVFIKDEQDPDPARRFKWIFQVYLPTNKPGPTVARNKILAYGPDERTLHFSEHNPILSPNDGFEQENHFLMLIPYKGHYLLLYECGWYQPDGTGNFGAYMGDIRVAHSRDCEHFTRIDPDRAIIPVGGHGEWDERFQVISDKVIIKDDTIYLYYSGQGNDWTSWPPSNGNRVEGARLPVGAIRLARMGLATLRLDGFTCMRVSDGISFGNFTTREFEVCDPAPEMLTLNLGSTRAGRSWAQVEALDAETGEPIAGFTREDCPLIATDSLRAPVKWKGGSLADLSARRFKLRFHLYGAVELYSFKFA